MLRCFSFLVSRFDVYFVSRYTRDDTLLLRQFLKPETRNPSNDALPPYTTMALCQGSDDGLVRWAAGAGLHG